MLVGVMSLLFPKWNLISLYIGRNGSDFSLIVTTAIDIIVFFFASRLMEKALGKYMHLINTKLILLLGLPVIIIIFIINVLCVMPSAKYCIIAFMISVPLLQSCIGRFSGMEHSFCRNRNRYTWKRKSVL